MKFKKFFQWQFVWCVCFYDSFLAIQAKWRLHSYKWCCPGLCFLQVFTQEGRWFQDTSFLLRVDQGTACSLAARLVRTPRRSLAPRQIESCSWDLRLCWLFIVLLRAGHSSLVLIYICCMLLDTPLFPLKLPLPEISVIPSTLATALQCSWPPTVWKTKCILATYKGSFGVSPWVRIWL